MLLPSLNRPRPRPGAENFTPWSFTPPFSPSDVSERAEKGEEVEVEGDGEVDGEGEAEGEEDEEWVAVGEVAGDEEVERPLVCVAERRRRWRSVLDSSRASAPRLANSALVWLEGVPSEEVEVEWEEEQEENAPPSWGYFRSPGGNGDAAEPPEEGRRPEKLAARMPVRRGSVLLPPRPLGEGVVGG